MVTFRRLILVVLATVVIFGAGVVTGGFLSRHLQTSPVPSPPQPFVNRFDMVRRALEEVPDLTPEQRTRIHRIIRENQELMAEYFRILQPDTQQVFRSMREGIRAQLSVAQRKRFEEAMRNRFGPGANRRPQPPAEPGLGNPGSRATPERSPQP